MPGRWRTPPGSGWTRDRLGQWPVRGAIARANREALIGGGLRGGCGAVHGERYAGPCWAPPCRLRCCRPGRYPAVVHPVGELATARAAAALGAPIVLSTVSSHTLKEVAHAGGEAQR